ncbi:mechanosensitive ion channel family protein [Histidinibacterium aquaticum]|uniref:Mechanosensitive ion channel family protein n=2 Tax=Histidinibacterium aquaticum TaxID=2613962 RepID=A0A5J5GG04_9RHOB|nr:mechanosensitive ion channel family protein [Histidinibacterium aquaticum]
MVTERWLRDHETLLAGLIRRSRRPLRLVAVLIALAVIVPQIQLPGGFERVIGRVATILSIIVVGWTVILLTDHFAARSVRRYRIDTEDNLAARKYLTQLRILKRAVQIIAVLVTVAAALLTFESVRRYGVSLLASAGAAGLILGLAARPVLSNLIAGIQIALTQPIRLEDVVIVEGEWGWIEEIFATYVVVRLWDWRRMVVPISYFIEEPFQNWTREGSSILGSVYWYLDYTMPVDEMREKLDEFIAESPYWDGQAKVLQVVDTDKDTMHLRALMSSRTAPLNWDMRCEIREKMIDWMQKTHPEALPRLRGELTVEATGMAGNPKDRPPAKSRQS